MAVLSRLSGPSWLMAALLYGAGLRLLECLRLRVQDVDFDRGERLMGHAGIATTMRYLHVVGRSLTRAASPLDHLCLSAPLPRR